MKIATTIEDKFEYKGKEITVHKDGNQKYYFVYEEKGKEIILSLDEMNKFIESSFSHTTINNTTLDVIEKSIKIDELIYNLNDLEDRLKKYK